MYGYVDTSPTDDSSFNIEDAKMTNLSESFHLDSASVMHRNREAFLANFAEHVNAFDSMVERWMTCIHRVGAEGKATEDPVIAYFAVLLLKHASAGFHHLSCYQSSLLGLFSGLDWRRFCLLARSLMIPITQLFGENTGNNAKLIAKPFRGTA